MKVINLFAGPCTGKSTLAYDLMARMKKLGLKVELIHDTPRDEVFSESWKRLNDHLLQLTTLQHKLNMLKDVGLDYVVMESPILMRMAYAENEPEIIRNLIVGLHKEQDSINVNLLRNPTIAYDETGRDQKLEEALERTKITENLVRRYVDKPINIMAGIRDVSTIFKELKLEDKISIEENSNIDTNDLVKALPDNVYKQYIINCESSYPYVGIKHNGSILIYAHDAQNWEIEHGIEAQRGDAFAKLFYDQLSFKLSSMDLKPYVRGEVKYNPFHQSMINKVIIETASFQLTPHTSKIWGQKELGNIFIDIAQDTLNDMGFNASVSYKGERGHIIEINEKKEKKSLKP